MRDAVHSVLHSKDPSVPACAKFFNLLTRPWGALALQPSFVAELLLCCVIDDVLVFTICESACD